MNLWLRACRCSERFVGTFTLSGKWRIPKSRWNWQMLWANMVWVQWRWPTVSSISCGWSFCVTVATANCGTLMGSSSIVNVSSGNIANDLARIDLFNTMIRSPRTGLSLMNLFGSTGHVGRLDQWRLHNRSRRHFRWMTGHNTCCPVNLEVHRSKVFFSSKDLHEPSFGSNFAIFDVRCAYFQGFAFWRLWCQCMFEPSILLRIEWDVVKRPWLWRSPYLHTYLGWSIGSRFPLIPSVFWGYKNRFWNVRCMWYVWCDSCTWNVYDLWSSELWWCSINKM